MRPVPEGLLRRLRSQDALIVTCWLITLQDGTEIGCTSHDVAITYGGVTYNPANGVSADAMSLKDDFSSSNSSAKIIYSMDVPEKDVRGGRWDGADVQFFWIDPEHPELGTVNLLRGFIGEITTDNLQFSAELRSQLDTLGQPFSHLYNLECDAQLGDLRCGVNMNPLPWQPNTTYVAAIDGDARIGGVVTPIVKNGIWYACTGGSVTTDVYFNRGETYAGLGADPFSALNARDSSPFGKSWYSFLFAMLFEASLASFNPPGSPNFVKITLHGGKSGATEPVWPGVFTSGDIHDGEITWTPMVSKQHSSAVTAVLSRMQFVDQSLTQDVNLFQYGWLRWDTGENAGREVEVRQHTAPPFSRITLLEVMAFPIVAGDEYTITWGCSKTRPACLNKFNNMLNYRGFPDMPTEDRALQTPNFSTANNDFTFGDGSGGGKK